MLTHYFRLELVRDGIPQCACLAADGRHIDIAPDRPLPEPGIPDQDVYFLKPRRPGKKQDSDAWMAWHAVLDVSRNLKYMLDHLSPQGWSLLATYCMLEDRRDGGGVLYIPSGFGGEGVSAPVPIMDGRDFDLIIGPYLKYGNAAPKRICPSCRRFFPDHAAVSRRGGAAICPACAMWEAMEDAGMSGSDVQDVLDIAWKALRNSKR